MKKGVKFALKLLVSLLALYLVFRKLDIQALGHSLSQLRLLWLVAALSLFVLSQYLSALRLNVLLRRIKVQLSERINFRLYLLGMYYNLFLPGGIGGDGYKVYLLHRRFEAGIKQLVRALLLDRLVGLVALGGLLILLFYFSGASLPYGKWAAGLFPLGLLLFWLLVRVAFRKWTPDLPITIGWSFAVQGAQVLAAWCLLVGLSPEAFAEGYLFLFLLSSVAAAIPFTIGGAGARELVFLYGAGWLGLEEPLAVSLSLLFYGLTVLVSLAGGYFSFSNDVLQRQIPPPLD